MIAEESIPINAHHFYEVPLPDDLFSKPSRRPRWISVALAHSPRVRRTRLEYKESALSFRIVRAQQIEDVAKAYRQLKKNEKEPPLPEEGFSPGPNARRGGTVQGARILRSQIDGRLRERPYFIVVTHSAPNWAAEARNEEYALVLVIEDLSNAEARLYSQIREMLRIRERVRART